MGEDLLRTEGALRGWIRASGERLGVDLERICRRGPDRELRRTLYAQPLVVAVSLGYLERVRAHGVVPDVVLGHSLGEITALAASGVVTADVAVAIAGERGRLMEQAAARVEGGMLAVLEMDRERLRAMLAGLDSNDAVVMANDNAPGQVVVSGRMSGLAALEAQIRHSGGGRCKRLPVSGPWHSPWMRSAQEAFGEWLRSVPFAVPAVPILCNGSAQPESDPERIRTLLVRALCESVRWRESMGWLKAAGVRRMLEIGPGRVLSGLARANGIGPETEVVSVNSVRAAEGD